MKKLMVYSGLIVCFGVLLLSGTGCKKKGCTSPTATNFDPDAEKDDGTCLEPGAVTFDRSAMLTNYANNLILPAYTDFQILTDDFNSSAIAFTAAPSTTTLQDLKDKFIAIYLGWQTVSSFEFGPAMQNTIRANLNTYPSDTAKINNNIATSNFNLDVLSNSDAKGLPAIDYLLYGSDESTTLQLFTTDQNAYNRMQYLETLVSAIKTNVDAVSNGWSLTGDNYTETFVAANGSDVGSSLGMLVNSLNLQYEKYFRDGKIGIPVGIRSLGIALPYKTEAYYVGNSVSLALENLQSMENVFMGVSTEGVDGSGLDDHLDGVGASDINAAIKNKFTSIKASLQTLSDPLSIMIINDQTGVEDVYYEIQQLIVLLKVDMPSRLGVLITYQDNDGD